MTRVASTLILVLALWMIPAACYAGPLQIGVRAGTYTDNTDAFVGVDAKIGVLMFDANPSIEYIFVDGADVMTFNADVLFTVLGLPKASAWLGAGIGLMQISPDQGDSTTDPLFNVIAGAGLGIPLNPYLMVKWVFADQSDGFVVGVGVRF